MSVGKLPIALVAVAVNVDCKLVFTFDCPAMKSEGNEKHVIKYQDKVRIVLVLENGTPAIITYNRNLQDSFLWHWFPFVSKVYILKMKALIKSFKKRYQSAKKLMNKCLQPNYLTRGKQTTKPMGFFFSKSY